MSRPLARPVRVLWTTLATLVVSACAAPTDSGSAPLGPPTREIRVVNNLIVPVFIDGRGQVESRVFDLDSTIVLINEDDGRFTVSPENATYIGGADIVDDLNPYTHRFSPTATRTEITNVIDGFTYVAVEIEKAYSRTIGVAIYRPSTGLRCLGTQSGTVPAFWGYYRLESGFQLRLYSETSCTGAYRFWDDQDLRNFAAPKSGYAPLYTSVAP